jgi:hypothetical protein
MLKNNNKKKENTSNFSYSFHPNKKRGSRESLPSSGIWISIGGA